MKGFWIGIFVDEKIIGYMFGKDNGIFFNREWKGV